MLRLYAQFDITNSHTGMAVVQGIQCSMSKSPGKVGF